MDEGIPPRSHASENVLLSLHVGAIEPSQSIKKSITLASKMNKFGF